MSSLGTASLGSEFDAQGLKSGLDRALGHAQGFMGGFKRIFENAVGFIIANVIMRLVSAIRDIGQEVFNAAARFQALQIQMEGLTAREIFRAADGTMSFANALTAAVKPAKELVDWVKRIAVTTPFTVESLQNTLSTAMAMGFASDEAKRLTVAAGNFTAGMGLTNEVLQRIIYNFGQMKASGKIMGTELRDLARGALVPVNDVLAEMQKKLGMTGMTLDQFKDKVQSSEEGVDLFISTFVEMVERDFGGAAERMSRTWSGITSNIKDFIQANLGAGVVLPTLDRISASLASLLDELLRPDLQGAMDRLGQSLAGLFNIKGDPTKFVDKIVEGINNLATTIQLFDQFRDTKQLLTRLGLSTKTVNVLMSIGDGMRWVKENWDELKIAILAVAAPSILAGVIGAVAGIVAALASPIAIMTLLIAAIAALYFAWQNNWGGMRDTITRWWNVVRGVWDNLVAKVQAVGSFLGSIFGFLAPTFQALWQSLVQAGQAFYDAFAPVLPQLQILWDALRPVVNFIGTVLVATLIAAAVTIGAIIVGIIGIITGLINGIAQGITAFLSKTQGMAQSMAQLWSGIIAGWAAMWNIIVGVFTGNSALIRQGWESLKQSIVTIGQALWNNIKMGFSGALAFVSGLVSGFVTGVVQFFTNLYNSLVGHSIVPDIMNGIIGIFSGGFPALMGVIQTGLTMFQTVFATFLQLLLMPAQIFTQMLSTMFMTAQMFMTTFIMTVQLAWVGLFTKMTGVTVAFVTGAFKLLRLALSTFINQMNNVVVQGQNLKNFIGSELVSAFGDLAGAVAAVTSAVRALQRAFNSLHVPDIFTPGSPTPFEVGLRGILGAMGKISDTALPGLQSGLSGLSSLEGLASVGSSTSYETTYNFRDTTLDEERLRAIHRRQEIMNYG